VGAVLIAPAFSTYFKELMRQEDNAMVAETIICHISKRE